MTIAAALMNDLRWLPSKGEHSLVIRGVEEWVHATARRSDKGTGWSWPVKQDTTGKKVFEAGTTQTLKEARSLIVDAVRAWAERESGTPWKRDLVLAYAQQRGLAEPEVACCTTWGWRLISPTMDPLTGRPFSWRVAQELGVAAGAGGPNFQMCDLDRLRGSEEQQIQRLERMLDSRLLDAKPVASDSFNLEDTLAPALKEAGCCRGCHTPLRAVLFPTVLPLCQACHTEWVYQQAGQLVWKLTDKPAGLRL